MNDLFSPEEEKQMIKDHAERTQKAYSDFQRSVDMAISIAISVGVGTSILMVLGFIAFILVVVGIVKSQKIVSQSIDNPSQVATMVIMGMISALLVGLPGVNIVLASIFMHMVRTVDR